jgi:hypothetical protein
MQQEYADAVESADHRVDTETIRTRCEQLHLRNYDESRRYQLTVSVSQPNGGPEHEATYELAPRDVESELQVVPPGRYEVQVSGAFRPAGPDRHHGTTGSDEETVSCNVGDRPQQTVVVECGNGVVTVSEGLSV